jgi:hypothetical protein
MVRKLDVAIRGTVCVFCVISVVIVVIVISVVIVVISATSAATIGIIIDIIVDFIVDIVVEVIGELIVTDEIVVHPIGATRSVAALTVVAHRGALCRSRRTRCTLATTSTASPSAPPTCTLRARGLALATFIRHVKTFPYGNRSQSGAECRRAQASLLRYAPP